MSDLSKLPQASKPCLPRGVTDQKGKAAFEVRFGAATAAVIPPGSVPHTTNGDKQFYQDKSGMYSKCSRHKSYGVLDPKAFKLSRKALGLPDATIQGTANFEMAGLLGAGRKLNGPLGAFALTLIGGDPEQFGDSVVSPPPKSASPECATALVELYWASLLRDVPFTEYATNPIAVAAVAELTVAVRPAHDRCMGYYVSSA
jgi:hypothetical protein